MAMTAAELERRRKFLGSSDAPIIMGVSPFSRNAADIAMLKRGEVDEPAKSTTDQEIGSFMEPAIAQLAAKKYGWELWGPKFCTSEKYPFACANLDQTILHQRMDGILECKHSAQWREWGDATDGWEGLPIYYAVQIFWQLGVTGWPVAYLAAVIANGFGHELRIYRIDRDEEMIDQTMEAGRRWWDAHVVRGEPVPMLPSLEFAIRRKRVTGKVVEIADPEVFHAWEELRQERLAVEKREEEALTRCLLALGDADIAKTQEGLFRFEANKRGARTPRWVEREE